MPQQGIVSHPGLPVGQRGPSGPPSHTLPPSGGLDPREATQGASWQPQEPGSVLSRRPDLADATRAYIQRGRVNATERAHQCDWRIFLKWCGAYGADPLPASADTVIAFLTDMARTRSLATLHRYKGTITKVHGLHGFPLPTMGEQIRAVMHGIAVDKGERSPNAKAPATADVFSLMIEKISNSSPKGLRDRAILLVGAVTGMRSAELTALNVDDLTWHDKGLSILIRRSKTDQTGVGRYVAVPCDHADSGDSTRCGAHAIRAWLEIAKISSGPLFRSFWHNGRRFKATRLPAANVADVVKSAAAAAGLEPKVYGAHSLRSGYVTQARRENLSFVEIMEQTGHKDLASVKRYARDPIDPFRTGRVREVARAFARNPNPVGSRGGLEERERTGGK